LAKAWQVKGVRATAERNMKKKEKERNGMEPADFWTEELDNGVLVKVEENVKVVPRHRKKSVQFIDF